MSEKLFYNEKIEDVAKRLETNIEKGLTTKEAAARNEKYGFNELKGEKKKSLFVKFLEQFKDFMIIILLIAAVVSRNNWNV